MKTSEEMYDIAKEALRRCREAMPKGYPADLPNHLGWIVWPYHCSNEVQEFDRIAFHLDGCEVQLNWIYHAKKPHYHDCDMTSLILAQGYTWHLKQHGSENWLAMFAAPGSLLRMGPKDEHFIDEMASPSLSLCVFENQTNWHEHYPPITGHEFANLLIDAISTLKTVLDRWQ